MKRIFVGNPTVRHICEASDVLDLASTFNSPPPPIDRIDVKYTELIIKKSNEIIINFHKYYFVVCHKCEIMFCMRAD